MKILIYGAGVIGSIFAYKLKSGGNDVTVLARGERLEQLRKYGIVIKDGIFNTQFETDISTTDRLGPDDYYDMALIIMQSQQVGSILPVLKKNQKIPYFIFMGNNVNGAEEYLKFLDSNRILLGFGGPGGYREDHFVIAAYVKDYCIIYFGELNGEVTGRVETASAVFQKSGIIVRIQENIDAWLKTHAAFISALVMGSYAAKYKNKKITDDDRLMTLSIKALRENFKALEDLGIPLIPRKNKMLKIMPGYFLKRKLKTLIDSEFGRIALSSHADFAKNEMEKISRDFRNLVKDVKKDMSASDYLFENSFNKIIKKNTFTEKNKIPD